MRYIKSDRLYCFSPPVMLATFLIEIIGMLVVLLNYRRTAVARVSIVILACLAIFQLAEYNVCEGAWGIDSLDWARLGYVAITLLPPLGLHLAARLAGRSSWRLLLGVYAIAAVFISIFLFVGQGMQSQQCLGNYVIFKIAEWATLPYVAYYYGLLLLAVGYIVQMIKMVKKKTRREALVALAFGYSAFIVPTTAANMIDPSTIAGIPSIMCGFAVILAVILVMVVVPRYHKDNG